MIRPWPATSRLRRNGRPCPGRKRKLGPWWTEARSRVLLRVHNALAVSLPLKQEGRTSDRRRQEVTEKRRKIRKEKNDRRELAGFLCAGSLVAPPELAAVILVVVPGSRIWEETQRRARLAGHGCNTVDDVRCSRSLHCLQCLQTRGPINPRCDSSRGLAAGVEFPKPGGGMGRGGSRRAMPDAVVAQRREDDAASQRSTSSGTSRKCGGGKTAPFNDIPERELDAWPSHRPIHARLGVRAGEPS